MAVRVPTGFPGPQPCRATLLIMPVGPAKQSCLPHRVLVFAAALLLHGSAAAQTVPASPQREFQAAVAAYDGGRPAEAADRLERLAPAAPQSFELHELLGLCYGALSRNDKAIEQMREAVHLRPSDAPAHTNLATALVRAGQPREAEAEYRAALAHNAASYSASHDLADLLLREDRVAEAMPLLETAYAQRPEAAEVGYNLALAYLTTGKLEQARSLAGTLEAKGDSGELHSLLGRIAERQGRFLDAAHEFEAAARMDASEDNLFAWGSELLLHRAYESAIAVFAQGTERFPRSPRLWVGLGMANYSRGRYEPAIHALLTAADLNPHDPRCYLFLSKAYLSSPSQAEQVIARFRTYYELEPKNALAAYYAAVSLWKGRRVDTGEVDYPAVETLLRRSLELDDTNAEVHLQLGILYTDERAFDKALPEFERALQLQPNLPDAHFRLGRALLRAGEKEKAEAEFATFKKLQAEHQAELDRERAEVQQFVVATAPAPAVPR